MEISPESALNSTGDPAQHCPERGRGHTPSTTDSAFMVFRPQVYKMLCLYIAFTIFLCLPTSIYSAPTYHEQSQNIVYNEGRFQNKNEQYYLEDAGRPIGGNKDPIKKMSLIKEKIREKLSTLEHDKVNVKAKPFTIKAEISLEWKDIKDFFRGLAKGSSTTSRGTGALSHRSARDTEPEMSATETGDGPWISNLSPAAVVGTIVGGTIGIFVIVVLTVIFCSYRNYSSLEMRQRTSDVYSGGNGHRHAERRM